MQLKREPRPFPTISFARPITDITDFRFEDIILSGYNPHPKLEMDMSV